MLLVHDRLDELRLRAVGGRRYHGVQRLGCTPQRLVETVQELRRKAGRKGRTGLIDHLADALEAEAAHEQLRFLAEAERGERQLFKSETLFP
jgi:alanine racemase